METPAKKVGFGFRGWMLILYQAIAFFTMVIFTNYPQNMLADMYGGASIVSTVYTVGMLSGVVLQLILSRYVGRMKSVKRMSVLFGVISLLLGLGIMLIPPAQRVLWLVCFGLTCLFVLTYCTFTVGIIVGQWFPRRKGTVMGIATFTFPIGNALLSVFAANVFTKGTFIAFLPFYIVAVIGLLLCILFVKDYPEQCGCYRDNDRNMTPEAAKAMMDAEIEAKKTSVWTLGKVLTSRDFWFIMMPIGILLACSVGLMTQIVPILLDYVGDFAAMGIQNVTMLLPFVSISACIGSWLLGVMDTKLGTRKAILITCFIMVVGGALGAIRNVYCLLGALLCLSFFMGGSSNFSVSAAAQYWRREDFANTYAVTNPVVNIIQSCGPMIIAVTGAALGFRMSFGAVLVLAVIGVVLMLLFSPKHLKEVDDKYRLAAGKPLDDALVGRK